MRLDSIESNLRPILMAVLASGMRKAEVARRLGVSRALITEISAEARLNWQPRYAVAMKLLALHGEIASSATQEPAHV